MKLPDKPSDLIELALADFEKVEKMPEVYEINMSTWHTAEPGMLCQVCLAGSVIAQTLGRKPQETVSMSKTHEEVSLDEDTWRKLRALDDFRCGRIAEGLYEMRLIGYDEYRDREIEEEDDGARHFYSEYEEDPAEFKVTLRDMAECLRKEGY